MNSQRSSKNYEVLIPMVGNGAQPAGALCRALANAHEPPRHPANLIPTISELKDRGLYPAGEQARAALRRLFPRGMRRWLGPLPGYLSVANPGDIIGLGAANARSAELGLALALALHQSQSPMRSVLASGALNLSGDDTGVPIAPVRHLGAKFRLIQAHFTQAGGAKPPARLLVPTRDPDGADVPTRYRREIEALSALKVTVLPVADLRGALERLGASKPLRSPWERWLKAGAAALLLVALLATSLGYALMRTVQLDFAAKALDDGSTVTTPFRAAGLRSGNLRWLPPCPGAEDQPLYRDGDRLVFNLLIDEPNVWWRRWLGYHMVMIAVTPSGVKLLSANNGGLPDTWRAERLGPDRKVEGQLPVRGQDERNLLIVLARRGWGFDGEQLERRLRDRLVPLQPGERISAARNFLRAEAGGMVSYLFRTTTDATLCP